MFFISLKAPVAFLCLPPELRVKIRILFFLTLYKRACSVGSNKNQVMRNRLGGVGVLSLKHLQPVTVHGDRLL